MIVNRLKLLVGGVQLRDGVTTVTDVLGKIFTRAGLYTLAEEKGYASTIYGAHQFDPMVTSDQPVISHADDLIDVLVALEFDVNPDAPDQPNRDTILRHGGKVADRGILLYDSSAGTVPVRDLEARKVKVFPLPARTIAQRDLKMEVVKNTIFVGALFRVLEFDMDQKYLRQLIEERFLRKGQKVVDINLEAARRGMDAIEKGLTEQGWKDTGYRLEPRPTSEKRAYISGTDTLCMGAIDAGCRFYAGYPITPASGILEFMEQHLPRYGGRALQGQNERESIRAAIGAALAGVRSATGSSGPGISLKVEEIGAAATTETAIVIIDAMRAGPSTGMPTKSEQGDLGLVCFGAAGDIPRIVLAPATTEECYTIMYDAFNYADKYQCPVFVLTDLTLMDGRKTIPEDFFTRSRVRIDRGAIVREEDIRKAGGYKRYAITDHGISPRLIPGTPGAVFKASGAEHDEHGFVTTEAARRRAMMEKRMRKLETYLAEDVRPPQVFGKPDGVPVLVGWGSSKTVLLDAQAGLQKAGTAVCVIHFSHLWPFPTAVAKPLFDKASAVIVCEQNFVGQFADVIQQHCLIPARRIVKYNGRPFYPSDIIRGVREIVRNGRQIYRVGEEGPVMPAQVTEGDM
ncbi:MAG: 2-oxoacid:acceptor oxidoreductase subunit alpha [Armatimonadetes bacterium]|nr:2-oxoacid:acceptor oxidoreductase subunit alpha [Armatimonadota bacterium]